MTTLICFGCGSSAPDGLSILGQYLCPDCEAGILRSTVNQTDYPHWIDVCRKFWKIPRVEENGAGK